MEIEVGRRAPGDSIEDNFEYALAGCDAALLWADLAQDEDLNSV